MGTAKLLHYCGYTIANGEILLRSIGHNENFPINAENIEQVYKDIQKYPIFGMQDIQKGLTLEELSAQIREQASVK